jgi:hypothetical protein
MVFDFKKKHNKKSIIIAIKNILKTDYHRLMYIYEK